MIYKSAMLTQASGSIGGITASRNRGGEYFRKRIKPADPSSVYQQAVRAAMASLGARWTGTLTEEERAAWDAFANDLMVNNALGDGHRITGLAMYNRCNVPRIQSGLSVIDTSPTNHTMALLSPVVPTYTISTGGWSITFDNTDEWASATTGALLLYASTAKNASINFFKGPYRYLSKKAGASTPPSSPWTFTGGIDIVAGQKLFCQFRAVNADGRVSAPFRVLATLA